MAHTDEIETLRRVGTVEAAQSLRVIADTDDSKEQRKAARKALYLLTLAGVRPEGSASAAILAVAPDTLCAWASAYDGAGNRLLFLAVADPDGGKRILLQYLLNDEQGIQSFDTIRLAAAEVAERIRRFEDQLEQGLALAEIPGDYGRWLLRENQDLTRMIGRQSPAGSLHWLERVGEPKGDYTEAPVWQALDAGSLLNDETIDRDGGNLFKLKWYDAWFFSDRDAYPWTQAWVAGDEEADEGVRIAHNMSIGLAIDGLMKPNVVEIYARRLEETADILLRRDQLAAARQGLFHALDLRSTEDIASCEFAKALVRRSIEAVVEIRRQRGDELASFLQ